MCLPGAISLQGITFKEKGIRLQRIIFCLRTWKESDFFFFKVSYREILLEIFIFCYDIMHASMLRGNPMEFHTICTFIMPEVVWEEEAPVHIWILLFDERIRILPEIERNFRLKECVAKKMINSYTRVQVLVYWSGKIYLTSFFIFHVELLMSMIKTLSLTFI